MNKLIATVAVVAAVLVASASGATATGPTCENFGGSGWKNHGEHVLHYVNDGVVAGGAPAHLSDDRSTAPAPGASFCLDQARNPGLHF